MGKIRIALVGLSASAKTAWASEAHLPYLLSPRGKSKYEIVALVNSSAEAARKAIAAYGFDEGVHVVRGYGSVGELVEDIESNPVDLVVVNTRVDVHFGGVWEALNGKGKGGENGNGNGNGKGKGKGVAVYCEWPLAENGDRAGELVAAAAAKGVEVVGDGSLKGVERTVVGLQGRVFPLVKRVKEVIANGKIGKVLSSEVRVFGGVNDRAVLPEGLEYFTRREVGGNVFAIGFAHAFDTVQHVLGELEKDPHTDKTVHGHFQLQRPENQIRGSDGSIVKTVASNVPDLFLIAGTLPESATVQKGATLHFRYRRGQAFPGDPALTWSIHGEKGEIRIVSPATTGLNIGADDPPFTVKLHDFATDEVGDIDWEWADWQKELPVRARNIGGLYEAFAAAWEGGSGEESYYPTFEHALKRHRQLEELISGWQG